MLPRTAGAFVDAGSQLMEMGMSKRIVPRASREAEQQCLIRESNEAQERLSIELPTGSERLEVRCECGDPDCVGLVLPTHDEYEAVRASGSHFIVCVNHENPETASVLREHSRFAVIDVVAADARYQALARHTRHAWVEGVGAGAATGPLSPTAERSSE